MHSRRDTYAEDRETYARVHIQGKAPLKCISRRAIPFTAAIPFTNVENAWKIGYVS